MRLSARHRSGARNIALERHPGDAPAWNFARSDNTMFRTRLSDKASRIRPHHAAPAGFHACPRWLPNAGIPLVHGEPHFGAAHKHTSKRQFLA